MLGMAGNTNSMMKCLVSVLTPNKGPAAGGMSVSGCRNLRAASVATTLSSPISRSSSHIRLALIAATLPAACS